MKKIVLAITFAASIVLLSGCASNDSITIKTYKDPKVNLDGYKKYQWLVGSSILIEEKKVWKGHGYEINKFVEANIAHQLYKMDIIKTQIKPDFIISYVVGVNAEAIREKVNQDGEVYFKNVPEKGLGIVFLDPLTKKVIWATNAEDVLRAGMSDDESKERISYAIKQMFTRF